MTFCKGKDVLISGASMAGLSTAYWMNELGYNVTVVEIASQPRTGGAAVDIKGPAVHAIKRMGIFEKVLSNRLNLDMIEFKNSDGRTESYVTLVNNRSSDVPPDDDIEIERDKFINILFDRLKDKVEFIFGDRIEALNETKDNIEVAFRGGSRRTFELVLGCDGVHSGTRNLWFGREDEYSHFLNAYFSNTIVNKLLVGEKSMQMYNEPNKVVMLNAYNNKTDIIFCFGAEKEIFYDFRNPDEQKEIIFEKFANVSWRTEELLKELKKSNNFYFDKFCQIKMPSWTKGRVALVGDAGYCASPAAGMGASLAVYGAEVLFDCLKNHNGTPEQAFRDYNKILRPFVAKVQASAVLNLKECFVLKSDEAIQKRNKQATPFWL